MEEENKNTNMTEEATTVGMFLKYTRMKQKKSIEVVSDALCIRRIYIKALEEDDYETLAPIPYGVGFVRSYASYLGLNADRIAQFYKQQALPEKEKQDSVAIKKHTEITKPTRNQIYIGLALIVCLCFVWVAFQSLTKTQEVVYSDQTTEQVIDVIPVNEENEVYFENEELKLDLVNADNSEQITVMEGNYQEEPLKEPEDSIEIKVKGDSWVELKDKDKVYLSGVYKKGFEYTAPATKGLILSVGRYYNVDVYINGVLTAVATPKKQRKIDLDTFLKH